MIPLWDAQDQHSKKKTFFPESRSGTRQNTFYPKPNCVFIEAKNFTSFVQENRYPLGCGRLAERALFFGLLTMITGAYLGTKQNDLKALLAYSTICQLGILMMLIGQDTEIAFKAVVIGIVVHALYKSSLFMLVGIIDKGISDSELHRGCIQARQSATKGDQTDALPKMDPSPHPALHCFDGQP